MVAPEEDKLQQHDQLNEHRVFYYNTIVKIKKKE